MQVGAAPRIVPSDPGVTGGEPARRGGESHRAEPPVRGADQIAQLMADKRTRAARMLVRHHGVPDQALRVGVDPNQRTSPTPPGTSWAGATACASTRGRRAPTLRRRARGSEM